jgi:hypothetical protein
MTLGFATKAKGTEPDHMIEFREGVELLKNEYPAPRRKATQAQEQEAHR